MEYCIHASRLIGILIISDAYSAQILGVSPVLVPLVPEKIHMPMLCLEDQFRPHNPSKWKTAVEHQSCWQKIQNVPLDMENLPVGLTGFGLQIYLACVWLRVLRFRHNLMPPARHPSQNPISRLTLLEVFSNNAEARSLAQELSRIFAANRPEFLTGNANSFLLWHLLNLQLTTSISVIEDAAGRNGPEAAGLAVESLKVWAQSPIARRGFVHAAQAYLLMTRHRKSDGVMLHSEMVFFYASLVMGFYLPTAPVSDSPDRPPFDVLEDVDWDDIGEVGLCVGALHLSPPAPGSASVFIQHGGSVCFHEAEYRDHYGAARRTFMKFAAQLEEVGKWNTEEYCTVLQILSNTLPGHVGFVSRM